MGCTVCFQSKVNDMTKTVSSPLGPVRITVYDSTVTAIDFASGEASFPDTGTAADTAVLAEAERQLGEYFAGTRRTFDLPLFAVGTAFQKAVWDALLAIPYGEVQTYGDIARALGKPGAARAVGMACHTNPICIVIPCHRVVGKAGLTGYAGGLHFKEALLKLEGVL